ncbi:MAG: histidine phosphatase family protein, partial [Deltaproteobacteria bacterium]|nr:histidine phosphatase family protein [Deltaproteobacteria bacterium]
MRLFLLRHGETDWNLQGRCQGVADLDLNERGKQQAVEVAEYLSREKIDAIYSSDLKRALQTAEAIRRFHDLEVTVDSDFRELDHGEFEGLTFTDIRASYPDFIKK